MRWWWCVVAIASAAASGRAFAQTTWKPEKGIEIIVGTSPGGGQDTSARLVQRLIQEKNLVEAPTLVVNKPGAGSALGTAYLNQHQGDAHYVNLVTTPLITNYITGLSNLSYADVSPLAILFDEYIVCTVAAHSPLRSGREVLERLRKDPASLSVGIPGVGGGGHLAFALAARAAGVDPKKLRTVVFKSGGDSIAALLGGHIDVMSSTTAAALPQQLAGKVRIVAVAAGKRVSGALADVPTWREQGSNAVLANWRGMIGARGLTRGQIAYWESVLARVSAADEFQRDLEKHLLVSAFMRSAEMGTFLKAQHDDLRTLLTDVGMAK